MISSILVFLIVLSILVIVHEFGHFIMARRAGVLVEEFGFGLPPRVWGIKIGETLYSINALPFGGFVKLYGEAEGERLKFPGRAFLNKDKKTRIGIIVAGVIMNFVLAIVAFGVVYTVSGIPKETKNVKVVEIATSSPAQIAGLVIGDIVRKVNNEEVISVSRFVDVTEKNKGKKIVLEIEKPSQGNLVKVTVTPRENPPKGEGPLGVTITTTEIYFPPVALRPFYGAYYGFKEATFWGKNVILGFVKIFAELFKGQAPKDVAGPIGIFAVTSAVSKVGILAVINFIGILSVNLAVLNVLPFPALDGGRLLFIGLESILGRKVLPKVESFIHTIGMIILLIALLAITAHDIQRLIASGSLSKFVDSALK